MRVGASRRDLIDADPDLAATQGGPVVLFAFCGTIDPNILNTA
jgi:hypothetical protein